MFWRISMFASAERLWEPIRYPSREINGLSLMKHFNLKDVIDGINWLNEWRPFRAIIRAKWKYQASDISCKNCHFSLTRSEWCCCRFDGSFLIELRLLLYLFLARKSCCARCLLPGACGVAFATYACGNSSTSPSDVSVMIHTHTRHFIADCTAQHTHTENKTYLKQFQNVNRITRVLFALNEVSKWLGVRLVWVVVVQKFI